MPTTADFTAAAQNGTSHHPTNGFMAAHHPLSAMAAASSMHHHFQQQQQQKDMLAVLQQLGADPRGLHMANLLSSPSQQQYLMCVFD